MKVTLAQVVNTFEVINRWGKQPFSSPVLGFHVLRDIKALEPEVAAYNETRMTLLNDLGTAPEGGTGQYTFSTPEKETEFSEQLNKLLATEVGVNISKLKLSLLETEFQKRNQAISLGEMNVVEWLIEDS